MKTKPMWGLWLLVIVAPIAVFIGVNYWKNLPYIDPLAVEGAAYGWPLASLRVSKLNKDINSVRIHVCNPKASVLKLQMHFLSDYKEVLQDSQDSTPNKNGFKYKTTVASGCGTLFYFDIKAKRKKPIQLKINWSYEGKSGFKTIEIKPESDVRKLPSFEIAPNLTLQN